MALCTFFCLNALSAAAAQPTISQIEIMEQPVDFSRLGEEDYRNSLTFGNRLMHAFDSILPFGNTPGGLELPHNLNTITLHFALPDWRSPHKVLYAHLLEGRDQVWSEPSDQPFVVLRDLPAGEYSFRVKARDRSGSWSAQNSFNIVIRQAWWRTGWAKAGLILIILGLVALLLHRWEQRKNEIREMQKLLEVYRTAQLSLPTNEGDNDGDGFLRLINHTLEEHVSDENFGIAELCELLNISRAQLHRKLKKRTGLSTSHYIRFLRLQMAREMLQDPSLNVSEVAFAVGFSNAAYFSRVFKALYGVSPSEAREQFHD